VIDEGDVERVVAAARDLPPAESVGLETDYVVNLLETVLDYMMQTAVVVRSLEYFRANRWDDVRTLDDLDRTFERFPDDKDGNVALALHLWDTRHWTRAHQLRDLARFFRSVGVVDAEALRTWAHDSEFRRDFEGRVKGLGRAVYEALVMRQGVDTVKPDVHVHRFAAAAVGRRLGDDDVVEVVTRAAARLGVPAHQLDWRIWEAGAAARSSARRS